MKNKFMASSAVMILALAGAFSISAAAQTTDEGTGPTEQPSAPMEIGQPQAQPTEAQPGGPTGEAPAQTDQGVARISMIHGDVSTQRGDSGDWSAATLNQPVVTGEKVSTADGARAELQLDFANTFRLGANSKANIANLTQRDIQIQLSQGIANYSVSKDSEAEPEIDTPNVSVHPAHHDGVFRVEVQPDGDTLVIVRSGEAQISTPQGSTEVRAGEMATVRGDSNSAQYKISSAPDRDDWDRWNSDRDHMIRNAESYKHTNRYYTGAQDLDAYGQWKHVDDYGDVWVPNEPDGWVPYREGNWTYEPYYGWTWVGYEPWGWAPYHYGRWFWYGNSWAWWPGPVGGFYRPFWAPAYVSFWGWGGGWGFGAGFGGWGGFGWLPVGPCDWYHPWWGGYGGRFGVMNVTNVHVTNINNYGGFRPLHGGNRFSNINNIHNDHVLHAMSTVGANRFGAGRVSATAVTRQQIRGARMMAGNLPVVPSRESLSASGRAAAPSTIRNGGSERFFGSPHNNVARRVSFDQQTASLRQTMQQNHVGMVPAGGRVSGGQSLTHGGNNAGFGQKPGAGTFGNREANNLGNRVTGNPAGTAQGGTRTGFRPFNPPPNNTAASNPRTFGSGTNNGVERGGMQSNPPANRGGFRPFNPPANNTRPFEPGGNNNAVERGGMTSNQNHEGFRPFTPPPNSSVSRGTSETSPQRGNNGNYWNRTAPSSPQPRYNSPAYGSSGNYGRPQLDMHQPIVRSPSYGGGSRPSFGGGNYGGGNGGYRAPSYGGGSRSTPNYGGSRPSFGGGGGGHVSGGGGGGGHSSGGGSHGGHR